MNRTTNQILTLLAAITLSGAALAGGNHPAGHNHGEDESAIGKPGSAGSINRTISVAMTDNMRFTPSNILVKRGETIRFTITPGQHGEIVWQFTKAGIVNFACLMPGHYEAGMKGLIKVGKK